MAVCDSAKHTISKAPFIRSHWQCFIKKGGKISMQRGHQTPKKGAITGAGWLLHPQTIPSLCKRYHWKSFWPLHIVFLAEKIVQVTWAISQFRLSGMSSTARAECNARKAEERLTLFHVENLIFSMASAPTIKIVSEADLDMVLLWEIFSTHAPVGGLPSGLDPPVTRNTAQCI